MAAPPTWGAVDRARNTMLSSPQESETEVRAQYRLGLHYLELGLGEEARHYFADISKRPGPVAQQELETARSRAALICGEWDEAREHLAEAWRLGAPESGILEGLAVVSLATNDPPRGATGRALALATAHPKARMLAAELLQRDGYIAETLSILEGLPEQLRGEDTRRAALRLGDAYMAANNAPEAIRAWETSPEIAEMRERWIDLLLMSRGVASGHRPRATSIPRTDGAAEALYLLAEPTSRSRWAPGRMPSTSWRRSCGATRPRRGVRMSRSASGACIPPTCRTSRSRSGGSTSPPCMRRSGTAQRVAR